MTDRSRLIGESRKIAGAPVRTSEAVSEAACAMIDDATPGSPPLHAAFARARAAAQPDRAIPRARGAASASYGPPSPPGPSRRAGGDRTANHGAGARRDPRAT